jgi:3-deoxy-manno-octulosonate cytidylyltransferase (CMP-KDO synthetase)|tara:strand:- start:150 stop:893 length:744 start_codon:yes stop_codon:yes gene_type:complete
MKVIGLIPTRLNSTRLPNKSLLPINGIPMIIHTYKRSMLAKKLDDLIVCCDDKKIISLAKKYNVKAVLTSKHHTNGTERIAEVCSKLKNKYDIILDIQGDEPLISPYHIDQVIDYHIKHLEADIVLPSLKIKPINSTNIVKIVKDKFENVLYLSRAKIPFEFKSNIKFLYKHLSIISFKKDALIKYSSYKKTYLEKIEDVELLRALEIGLKIKSVNLKGDSFSVDVLEDYKKATKYMKKDKFFKLYK